MNKLSSKAITGAKYVYLVAFFVLLSGFFYPIITGASFDSVITGTLILFVGLAGGVLLFKAGTSDKRRGIYLGGGFGLIAISLAYILQLTGRV
ncbi:hypothetical protein C6988_00945 [Nitrosopumilus sp. b1]|uniref:hypothetical protein n=1 Tax=Nitrosopumilus sp. b1 TaxID=2109907 RepID=UPI0015F428D4|nr:hypothetical protein [Nitrosopumilus sp. b1]KAF6243921.1 hypothetical protein C6988_00945 [Nitrosopumilus sp. b1]